MVHHYGIYAEVIKMPRHRKDCGLYYNRKDEKCWCRGNKK
jgi:hypothetical protein